MNLSKLLWPVYWSSHPGTEAGGKKNEGRDAKDQDISPHIFTASSIRQSDRNCQRNNATIDVVQVIEVGACAWPQTKSTSKMPNTPCNRATIAVKMSKMRQGR